MSRSELGRGRKAARGLAALLGARRWVVAAVCLAAAACTPRPATGYLRAFAAGERAMHAGRYGEAAARFDEAAKRATRVKDRDEARFLQARALERAGQPALASAAYRKLATVSPKGPRTARAEFEVAELEIAHGDAKKGRAALEAVMLRYPGHGLARPSLTRLVALARDEGGEPAAQAYLRRLAPLVAKSDLAQPVEYEFAASLERAGDRAGARLAFVSTAVRYPYPFGGLTDDAWWRASQLDEELGEPRRAIDDLRRLLAPREGADTLGSYERPRYSAAQMRIAELYRDRLGDRASARREFKKLYARHKTSVLRDDALWEAALLAREAGDAADACALVDRLVSEFAESRYANCGALVCAQAKKPKKRKACAEYVARRVRGEKAVSDPE